MSMLTNYWVWIALFAASLSANFVFAWYIRLAFKRLFITLDNIASIFHLVQNYAEHLNKLYSVELYYGDETLEALLEHTKFVLKELEKYEQMAESFMVEEQETKIDAQEKEEE